MGGAESPQKERNCSGVEAPRVPGAVPRRNEGHRGLRCCGQELSLGPFQEMGRPGRVPPHPHPPPPSPAPQCSFPVVDSVGWGGPFSYWSGLEGMLLLLGREVSSEHLSAHCVILGTLHSLSASMSPPAKYKQYFNVTIVILAMAICYAYSLSLLFLLLLS